MNNEYSLVRFREAMVDQEKDPIQFDFIQGKEPSTTFCSISGIFDEISQFTSILNFTSSLDGDLGRSSSIYLS